MDKGAMLSPDRVYRYSLWRVWDESKPLVMFIGLNPSTADELEDDPTIRRCINFARTWDYGGIYMMNLFAFRTKDPKILLTNLLPIGYEGAIYGKNWNDWFLKEVNKSCMTIVAAWGTKGNYLGRDKEVMKFFRQMNCLGLTKGGYPKHPLFLRSDTKMILFQKGEL